MKPWNGGLVLLVVAWLGACGSDGGGSTKGVPADSCHQQCDAQETVTGCQPFVDLATCKSMCDALAAQTPAACAAKFSGYYGCSASAGFECLGSLVTQKGGACSAEQKALDQCQNGGKSTSCAGALDGGFCPSVQCPCPSGTTQISGFDNGPSGCKCFDTTTCLQMCN